MGDFEYFWGDFLRMILEIKYLFFYNELIGRIFLLVYVAAW